MRIIFSPAKKMNVDFDCLEPTALPGLLPQTEQILCWLREQSYEALKILWKCSDRIAEQNFERLQRMDLKSGLTPAVLSYEGIAYQYMAPAVFEEKQLAYVQEHLRILSGFYGVLRPLDGVTPYRLEMQARAGIAGHRNLYDFWGSSLYEMVRDSGGVIVNLASKEYAKCIEKYITGQDTYITVVFCESSGDKLVTKGTYAKMARGDLVRFMAEKGIVQPVDIREYNRLGYRFREELSTDTEYIFEREKDV